MDAPEEFAIKERAMSPIVERGALGGGDIDVGGAIGVDEIPTTQVHSIDILLGDIYELRYQLVQSNSCMYRYRAERDRYNYERYEAHSSL